MKKVASLLGAGALLFGMVGSAFAFDFHHFFGSDTRVRNYARVTNDVDVDADSGDNEVHGMFVHGGSIRTGSALAGGLVTNLVNTTITGGEAEE